MTDQVRFADVSGDRNPMHLDPVLARRTQAGAPVVHGIHLLLWSLDTLAATRPELASVRNLRVQFTRFVYLGGSVELVLAQSRPTQVRLTIFVDGVPASVVVVNLGDAKPGPTRVVDIETLPLIPVPTTAQDLEFEQMVDRSGRLAFAASAEVAASMFPNAAVWLGSGRIAALAATSTLVGMVCPGLHAIYDSLSVDLHTESVASDLLAFRVFQADSRFRLIRQEIIASGLSGTLNSFARMPPTPQPTMESLAAILGPTEFSGSVTLIVGGSRGLGELTAKLIATGGGRVIITYQAGHADAKKVAQEIREAGGQCDVLHYDTREPVEKQLAHLQEAPTHVYYFATQMIAHAGHAVFAPGRFREFLDIYVDGFWRLCEGLRARRLDVSAFYPSSIFVEERPKEMAEYAMAKAAGEVLCAEMYAAMAPMHITVCRLPRLPTDQTSAIMGGQLASPVETMLPVVRQVQSWPKAQVEP